MVYLGIILIIAVVIVQCKVQKQVEMGCRLCTDFHICMLKPIVPALVCLSLVFSFPYQISSAEAAAINFAPMPVFLFD